MKLGTQDVHLERRCTCMSITLGAAPVAHSNLSYSRHSPLDSLSSWRTQSHSSTAVACDQAIKSPLRSMPRKFTALIDLQALAHSSSTDNDTQGICPVIISALVSASTQRVHTPATITLVLGCFAIDARSFSTTAQNGRFM